MTANWTWLIAAANGDSLAELTTASGRSISFKRNAYSEATFTLSHEDDVADMLLGALRNTGIPLLKCYRDQVLRFAGYLAPFSEDAEEASTLTPVFRSPFGRLMGDGSSRGRFANALTAFTQKDAGVIALDLIDSANSDSPTGLSTVDMRTAIAASPTTFPYTKLRDRTYPLGTNIGEAVTNLTNVLDGFDFEEIFLDGQGATLAEFHIMASQGVDRPAARFEYGRDTIANVRHLSRTTEQPINVARVLGGNGLVGLQSDQDSITKYGKWYWQESQPDVIEQPTLNDKATALLRPNPIKTITFAPELGLESCPRPWDNYWLGDTVFARRAALLEDVVVKVNSIVVTVDDNGNEASEVPDPSTPEEEAMIRSHLGVEVQGA